MSFVHAVAFATVILSWLAFALVFLTRAKPPKTSDQKKDSKSITGIVLQGLSYAIIWSVHRPFFTPMVAVTRVVDLSVAVVTIVGAVGSVMFTMSAVRSLGKEWSLTARVIEGHKLATQGPYALVRHPIYTGMLGMLIATGLAFSRWPALVIAILVFMVGTLIRIRSEESLLRELFGKAFDEYSGRVAAIIPGVF